jgi:hypothetical protein
MFVLVLSRNLFAVLTHTNGRKPPVRCVATSSARHRLLAALWYLVAGGIGISRAIHPHPVLRGVGSSAVLINWAEKS